MHLLFKSSQIKNTVSYTGGTTFDVHDDQFFWTSAANTGEYKVENLLDHRVYKVWLVLLVDIFGEVAWLSSSRSYMGTP